MEFLESLGYWGMFIIGFLAGSVFPFSSEAVMLALLAAGLSPWQLVVFASVGNVLGGMFNYWVGRLGNMEWIERYLHIKREKLEKTQRLMAGHGAWIGVLSFLPVLGSVITVALGFMRANIPVSVASITIGKVARYILLAYGATAIAG